MTAGLFKRTVEVGRVVLLNHGPYAGKLAVIVEIIDHNRALISGPTTGVPRQQYAYKRLTMTDFVVPRTPRGVRDGHLTKLVTKEDVVAKFNKTAWARKIEKRKIRASLNDFDRFKLMKLKKKRSIVIGKATPAAKKMLAK